MQVSQELNEAKMRRRASSRERAGAGAIFLVLSAVLVMFHLAATGRIDLERVLDPCGIKQRYHLPCPTCGMTTSVLAFARGRVLRSFYIQPAAALGCCIVVIAAFLALLTAVFGIHFRFLGSLFSGIKTRYLILALVVVIAAGWAVTLARALAANGRG